MNANPNQADAGPRRKLLLIGAGPLVLDEGRGVARHAPGVANRLWHFAQPALAAGFECLLLLIEEDGTESPEPRSRHYGACSWREATVSPQACKSATELIRLTEDFNPDVVAGVGTLLAGATACRIAGERPVWVDFMGDPLAEISAKAQILGETRFKADEYLEVWGLMLTVFRRADAWSVVSRRERDAVLGQLLLAGRMDSVRFEKEVIAAPTLRERVHFIPCCVESLEGLISSEPESRESLLERNCLHDGARVALWSGGFNAWADPVTLVRGLERAMDREPALHLVATGGELPGYLAEVYHEFQRLIAGSRHRERFHALGWLPHAEADAWLRAADVGIMTDRPCTETWLGSRNRLIFHAAARHPILASRGSEIIEDMEAADALVAFQSGDSEDLAARLLEVVHRRELARAVGERGFQYCRENYLFERTSAPFLAFAQNPTRDPNISLTRAAMEEGVGAGLRHAAAFLDVDERARQWRELEDYRAGRLSRLKRRLLGHEK